MEDSKKRGIRAIIACLFVMILVACSIFGDFDAKGYTQALLDQMFQGEVEELAEFDKKSSEKELKEQYKEYIAVFSEAFTQGLNASDEMQGKFDALCEEIFRSAKYQVTGAEKVNRDEYKVRVEIQKMDVFVKWEEGLKESVKGIAEKVERGEYQGTEQEILLQMLSEITAESYELLETAYQGMTYAEPERVSLTVKKNEKGKFEIKDEEISDLITKILCLDAIQD